MPRRAIQVAAQTLHVAELCPQPLAVGVELSDCGLVPRRRCRGPLGFGELLVKRLRNTRQQGEHDE